MRYTASSPRNECAPTRAISFTAITLRGPPNSTSTAAPTSIHFPSRLFSDVWFQIAKVESFRGPFVSRLGAICESAYDLTPKRLPTVTLVGRPINSSIQCVAVRGLGSDLDADRASDPTPNNTVLAYLSRYTHRVAISNRRLIALDQHSVTFKVKDYRIDGPGRYTTMTLDVREFIRRFLIHVLPKGFHRIRHYGLFASANRAETIARARELLGLAAPAFEEAAEIDPATAQPIAQPCPHCGGRMFVIETFEPGCQPRHPPTAPLAAIRIDTS